MKDLSFSFLTTGLIQVLNIATGLLAARLLLPEGRGELAALLLWPGLLAELGSLGLYDAVLYRAATRTENPRALFAAMAALTAVLSIVLIGIGFIVLPIVFAKHGDNMLTLALYFMCGFLPTYFTSLFSSGLFQGQIQITAWNVLRLLVPATYLIILSSLLLATGTNVADFAAAYVAAQAVAGVTGIVMIARRGWLSLRPDTSVIKGLLSYGIRVHFGEILYSMRQRLDQAAIAYWLPSADLGLYAVAIAFMSRYRISKASHEANLQRLADAAAAGEAANERGALPETP